MNLKNSQKDGRKRGNNDVKNETIRKQITEKGDNRTEREREGEADNNIEK